MDNPYVQQLKLLITEAQAQVAEYERQIANAQKPPEKTALNHSLADARDRLESLETDLAEFDADDEDSRVATWTTANFEQEVLQSDLPVLIDFWAEWCGPCKQLSPLIAELAHEFAGQVRFGKLNIDEETQIATQFDVQSLPTLMILHKRRVVDVIAGVVNYEQLRVRLQRLVKN